MQKILAQVFTLSVLLVLFGLAGCGDDGAQDPTEVVPEDEFRVTLRIVDTEGNPVPGLELGLTNTLPKIPELKTPDKAAAIIKFYLPYRAQVILAILDIDLETVRVLVDNDRDSDLYVTSWDGADDEGEPVPAGRYTVRLVVQLIGSGEFVFDASHDIYFAQQEAIHGPTDDNGRIVLRGRSLFPQFYERDEMLCLDEDGREVIPDGSETPYFNVTSSMRFAVVDPATADVQVFKADIDAEGDVVQFVWDPEGKALAISAPAISISTGRHPTPAGLKAGPDDWVLFPPYPNPF